jgi:hypothetical protein
VEAEATMIANITNTPAAIPEITTSRIALN